jgi:hypothetical protein
MSPYAFKMLDTVHYLLYILQTHYRFRCGIAHWIDQLSSCTHKMVTIRYYITTMNGGTVSEFCLTYTYDTNSKVRCVDALT